MNKKPQMQPMAFTTKFNGLSNKLYNNVVVITPDKKVKAVALWDTGATGTCISEELAKALNLIATGKRLVRTPTGEDEFNTYCVDLGLPNNTLLKDVPVTDSKIGMQGLGLLIGMDIIGMGDFAVSSYSGKTQFTFRIPSLSDADFVNNHVDGYKGIPIVKAPKIQPNDPCPCGSGKKYKFCCGKNS